MQLGNPVPVGPATSDPFVPSANVEATVEAARAEGLVADSGAPTGEELGASHGNLRLPVHVHARGLMLGVIATVAFVFGLHASATR